MSKILEKTVEEGPLANGSGWGAKFTFKDESGKSFRMPMAGKTGTPQNWSDAWAVGYSPYYTTAVWFGLDKLGNTLGTALTGSSLAGPVWGDYMRILHQGLPRRDFPRPSAGIVDVTVCVRSGLLRTAACNQGRVTLPFLAGTEPTMPCDIHGSMPFYEDLPPGFGEDFINSLRMPSLPPDLFLEIPANQNRNNPQNRNPGNFNQMWNPLLDGDRDTGIRYEPVRIVPVPVPVPVQENIAVETLENIENDDTESVTHQDEIVNLEHDRDPGPEMPYNPLLD
jgi:penicillin-binding protein 1A